MYLKFEKLGKDLKISFHKFINFLSEMTKSMYVHFLIMKFYSCFFHRVVNREGKAKLTRLSMFNIGLFYCFVSKHRCLENMCGVKGFHCKVLQGIVVSILYQGPLSFNLSLGISFQSKHKKSMKEVFDFL